MGGSKAVYKLYKKSQTKWKGIASLNAIGCVTHSVGSPCVFDLMQCSEVSDLVHSVQCSDKWSQWNWQKPHFFPLPTLAATHPSSAACDSSHFGCHGSVANSTPASPMEHTSIHRLDGIFAQEVERY